MNKIRYYKSKFPVLKRKRKNLQPLILIDPQADMKKKVLIRDLIPKLADWSEGEFAYSYVEKPTGIGRLVWITLALLSGYIFFFEQGFCIRCINHFIK